jgi:hypothetical protein
MYNGISFIFRGFGSLGILDGFGSLGRFGSLCACGSFTFLGFGS